MRHLIQQIIAYYPNALVSVSMDDGTTINGYPGSLLPAINAGLFQLVDRQRNPQEAILICHIASIRIYNETYRDAINYLQSPTPVSNGCCEDCQRAIHEYLPVGANVIIHVRGGEIVQGTVLFDEIGMLVLAGRDRSNPIFVSTCNVEIINKNGCPGSAS